MREWAHLRLSQRFQLPKIPKQHFYYVLPICAWVTENMTEERLRQLTHRLRQKC